MENLIALINGKTYLRFDYFIYNASGLFRLRDRLKKYNGIMQGAQVSGGGLFSDKVHIASILIPEENVLLFNAEMLNEI